MWASTFAKSVIKRNVKAAFCFLSNTDNKSWILLTDAKLGETTVWEILKDEYSTGTQEPSVSNNVQELSMPDYLL